MRLLKFTSIPTIPQVSSTNSPEDLLENIYLHLSQVPSLSLLHYLQFSSVAQSCLTLCNPMDCSTPGFPVHYQLPELAQTHVHWVRDAIQPSHSLSSPSLPAFNLSQHQGLFQGVSSLHQVAKVLEFQLQISPSNEYSGLISFSLGLTNLTGNISFSSFIRGISNYFPKFSFCTPLYASFPQLYLFTKKFCPLLGI